MKDRGNKPPKRRSTRLREYDYSQAGAYFVTICTHERKKILGEVIGEDVELSSLGDIAKRWIYEIPRHFNNVKVDAFVIMPNHVHSIIILDDDSETPKPSPATVALTHRRGAVPAPSPYKRNPWLGKIVAYFKYQTTKEFTALNRGKRVTVWQRNYYDHVIRNERQLLLARECIINNPQKWHLDKYRS